MRCTACKCDLFGARIFCLTARNAFRHDALRPRYAFKLSLRRGGQKVGRGPRAARPSFPMHNFDKEEAGDPRSRAWGTRQTYVQSDTEGSCQPSMGLFPFKAIMLWLFGTQKVRNSGNAMHVKGIEG